MGISFWEDKKHFGQDQQDSSQKSIKGKSLCAVLTQECLSLRRSRPSPPPDRLPPFRRHRPPSRRERVPGGRRQQAGCLISTLMRPTDPWPCPATASVRDPRWGLLRLSKSAVPRSRSSRTSTMIMMIGRSTIITTTRMDITTNITTTSTATRTAPTRPLRPW